MKSYTDLEQSKKLAEILPLESADMGYDGIEDRDSRIIRYTRIATTMPNMNSIPCWSLAALLEYLKNINSTVYIPMLYIHDNKWMLQFVERGHGNVDEVECDNPVDACYEMILKLNELNLL